MSMNTVIRKKRKELGLTQEQVAKYLGVSTPAVNKWEKGSTLPDITLLPSLARLLKTDVNTLLCFQEEMSSKEISLFLNHVADIYKKDGFCSAYTMIMEKIQEYPVNAELIYSLAMLLQSFIMMEGLPPEQRKFYDSQITTLYERVITCDDAEYSERANYMLASRLITAEQYGRAQKIVDVLPERNAFDRQNLQAMLWMKEEKYEEAAQLLERKVLVNLQEIQATLTSLAKIAVREGDVQHASSLAHCGQKTVELFGLWELGAFLVPLETAIACKNVEESISVLQAMLAALPIPWDMKKSPVCKHIQKKTTGKNFGVQFLPSIRMELENGPEYDFLRAEPAFQQLLTHAALH